MLKFRTGLSACLLAIAGAVSPGLARGDDLHTPYDLQVVVHFERHRVLTEDFRQQVLRELGDNLRTSLGGLARVRMFEEPEKLGSVLRGGLGLLDTWSGSTPGVKMHFVLIDYTDGQYDLRARQYDDTTGLASPGPNGLHGRAHPVIRQERTRDRAFVATLAAGMIEKDLGLLGTIVGKPGKDGLVQVRLHGGALGGPLDRLVRPGELFAIAAPRSPSLPGKTLPWSVLRVEKAPTDGVCTCRYFSLLRDPVRDGDLCMLLGTVTEPLRLHLKVADATSLTLEIRRRSFEDLSPITLTSRQGERRLITPANEPFANVAFVTTQGRRIPVALIDSDPVEIEVSAQIDRDPLRFSRENWEQNVRATFLKLNPLIVELNKRTRESKDRVEILRLAQSGLEDLHADQARLDAQRKNLLEEIMKLPPGERSSLAYGEGLLRQVHEVEEQLAQMAANLEKLEKEETKRQEWIKRLNEAQGLETQAEIPKALEIYHAILKEGCDEKGLAERVDKLEALWKPKNDKHKQARQFLYHVWPKQTTPRQLLDHLEQAADALNVCIEAKDPFGPKRFLIVTVPHGQRLAMLYAKLNPDLNAADKEPAEEIKELTGKLNGLTQQALKFLQPPEEDK